MKLIDALNRIERAGNEHSKTTEKLINAAELVGATLAEKLEDIDTIEVELATRKYWIERGTIRTGINGCSVIAGWTKYRDDKNELFTRYWGDFNREEALGFAHDLPAILQAIENTLTIRRQHNESATQQLISSQS